MLLLKAVLHRYLLMNHGGLIASLEQHNTLITTKTTPILELEKVRSVRLQDHQHIVRIRVPVQLDDLAASLQWEFTLELGLIVSVFLNMVYF